jgi:hypothetical protein
MIPTPILRKPLDGDRAVEVWPLTFGRARLLLVAERADEPDPDVLDGW